MTFTGLPEEAVANFSGYALSLIIGLVKVLFRCKAFFSVLFAFGDKLLQLSSPG